MSLANPTLSAADLQAERSVPRFNPNESIHSLTSALRLIAAQQRRIKELESEAETDVLTDLLNRRGLHKALAREMERAQRTGKATAILVLFDMDGLKKINDTMGHLAGDAAIAGFAHALKRRVRNTDYVARLGGDEFALLMTDGNPMQLQGRAAALCEHLNREIVTHDDTTIALKTSHGAATVNPGLTEETIMELADTDLYRCKETRKVLNKHLLAH